MTQKYICHYVRLWKVFHFTTLPITKKLENKNYCKFEFYFIDIWTRVNKQFLKQYFIENYRAWIKERGIGKDNQDLFTWQNHWTGNKTNFQGQENKAKKDTLKILLVTEKNKAISLYQFSVSMLRTKLILKIHLSKPQEDHNDSSS